MKAKVGSHIRQARLAKNYTQQYLAEQLKISVLAYGNIERGKTNITLTRLFEIARILEVPSENLITGKIAANTSTSVTVEAMQDLSDALTTVKNMLKQKS